MDAVKSNEIIAQAFRYKQEGYNGIFMTQNETLFSNCLFTEGLHYARYQKKVCVKITFRKFVFKLNRMKQLKLYSFYGFKDVSLHL